MKKDVNIIIGVLALVAVGFIVGYRFYAKPTSHSESSQELDASAPVEAPKADMKTLIGDGNPSLGPIMAKVVVVEYLDPECEACKAFHPRVKKVLSEFDGKVRFLTRHMPYHGNSVYAIKALEAALEQNKYWEMLDLVMENQDEWSHKKEVPTEYFNKYAKQIGINVAQFNNDMKNPDYDDRIAKDKKDGEASGVSGTPSFFINGELLTELGEAPLRDAINQALNK